MVIIITRRIKMTGTKTVTITGEELGGAVNTVFVSGDDICKNKQIHSLLDY